MMRADGEDSLPAIAPAHSEAGGNGGEAAL